jgi:hypothetical protein
MVTQEFQDPACARRTTSAPAASRVATPQIGQNPISSRWPPLPPPANTPKAITEKISDTGKAKIDQT